MPQMRWRHRTRLEVMPWDGSRTENTGAPRGVQRLLALVDTTEPAWPSVAAVLREYARAGGELDEEAVRGAVRLGRERHARRTAGDAGAA